MAIDIVDLTKKVNQGTAQYYNNVEATYKAALKMSSLKSGGLSVTAREMFPDAESGDLVSIIAAKIFDSVNGTAKIWGVTHKQQDLDLFKANYYQIFSFFPNVDGKHLTPIPLFVLAKDQNNAVSNLKAIKSGLAVNPKDVVQVTEKTDLEIAVGDLCEHIAVEIVNKVNTVQNTRESDRKSINLFDILAITKDGKVDSNGTRAKSGKVMAKLEAATGIKGSTENLNAVINIYNNTKNFIDQAKLINDIDKYIGIADKAFDNIDVSKQGSGSADKQNEFVKKNFQNLNNFIKKIERLPSLVDKAIEAQKQAEDRNIAMEDLWIDTEDDRVIQAFDRIKDASNSASQAFRDRKLPVNELKEIKNSLQSFEKLNEFINTEANEQHEDNSHFSDLTERVNKIKVMFSEVDEGEEVEGEETEGPVDGYCPSCGAEVNVGDRFCHECGESLQ